jgi:hypothetical protein
MTEHDFTNVAATCALLQRASTVQSRLANLAQTATDTALRETSLSYEPFRAVAGQKAYVALGKEIERSPLGALHLSAQRRWVAELTMRRVTLELELERAALAAEPEVRVELTQQELPFRRWPLALLHTATRTEAHAQTAAFAARAPALRGVAQELRARRFEVASRLGEPHAESLAVASNVGAVQKAAHEFLAATHAVALDALRREAKRLERPGIDLDVLRRALLAVDAPHGWPARLGTEWFRQIFASFADDARGTVPPLPQALGGASFMRAIFVFGAALRDLVPAAALPFSLRCDPYRVGALCTGRLFAAAARSAPFQSRVLGLGAALLPGQHRALSLSALLEHRVRAAAVVIAAQASVDVTFAEGTLAQALLAPLPEGFAGVWPGGLAPHVAFEAALRGAQQQRELVHRHDEDWFKNPRAVAELVAEARAAERQEPEAAESIETASRMLAQQFETELG